MLRGYMFRVDGRPVDIPLPASPRPKTIADAETLAMWASRSGLALALSHRNTGSTSRGRLNPKLRP